MKRFGASLSIVLCLASFVMPLQAAVATLENMLILTENYGQQNYIDKDGTLKGLSVDLLEKAYAQTGIDLVRANIRVQPWPRSYRQLQKGSNMMLFSMTRTEKREKMFKWAGPIASSKIVLIAKKNRAIKITAPKDLTQYHIGAILDDIGIELVRDLIEFDANILTTPHAKSLAKMLELGRIDLWVYDEDSAKQVFEQNNINVDDYEAVYTLRELNLYFAFSLDTDQKIVDRLQKALDEVAKKSNEDT